MTDGIFIGIDSGTQGVKALALDSETGTVLARAVAPHALIQGADGQREQEPQWWIDALRSVLSELLAADQVDAGRVRAMSVSGQQHGCVPLDAAGEVIRPAKLWCDTQTAPEAELLTKELGGDERVIELTGNRIATGFTASKLLWLRAYEPDNYYRLAMVLLPHDYINYWLTGQQKTECGDASGTAYFNVRARQWSAEVLRAIDGSNRLAECLPELISADEPVGTVLPTIATELGLPAGVLVAAGGGDNMLAAIGTGNVVPGIVTASLGTSGTIYATAQQPVVDPAGELAAFCSSTGDWLPLVCTMNVTVSTETTRRLLNLDLAGFTAAAMDAPVGSEGVILVPFFNGERTPDLPRATAGFQGLTPATSTPGNLSRAAIEGPTLGLRYALEVLKRQGIRPREIRLVGGGARNRLWRQIAADILGSPVICPVEAEAGALGAAIQALWCWSKRDGKPVDIADLTDRYTKLDYHSCCLPELAAVDRYNEVYTDYRRLVDSLTGYWTGS